MTAATKTLPESKTILVEEAVECNIPTTVFIQWPDLRLYLKKYIKMNIPSFFEGNALKVKRCLFFMSECSFGGTSQCLLKEEILSKQNITIKANKGEVIGYYTITFAEHKNCHCSKNLTEKERDDDPWFPPPIYNAKFFNKKENLNLF